MREARKDGGEGSGSSIFCSFHGESCCERKKRISLQDRHGDSEGENEALTRLPCDIVRSGEKMKKSPTSGLQQ